MTIQAIPEACASASERRRAPRVEADIPTDLMLAQGKERAMSRNISETGMFIETVDQVSLGDEFRVSLNLPEDFGEVEGRVEVVYRNPFVNTRSVLRPGVGLKFLAIEKHCLERIRAYIAHHHDSELAPFQQGLMGVQSKRSGLADWAA